MVKRSLLLVALAIANLNLALGGTPQAFGSTWPPPAALGALLTFQLPYAGGFIPSLEQMLSVRTRDLLAKKWRKAKIEKSVAYEGKPIDVRSILDTNEQSVNVLTPVEVPTYLLPHSPFRAWVYPLTRTPASRHQVFRGVKSSHSCWVKCKNNKDCSRFTYITGKWKKCELYRRGDKKVKKVKSRGAISGYADWRVTVKRWGKQKPVKKQNTNDKNNNKNTGGNGGSEPAYEAPGWSGEEAYEAPSWSGEPSAGSGNWNSEFGPSAPSGGGWESISDYNLMSGKTIFGRRINSILPCVGNIARRYTDCQAQCNRDGDCDAWTWASFDCSWVGDSKDSGVCYLMTDSDERDVFQAPSHGDFVSGIKKGGSGGGGGIEQPYEDLSGDELSPPVFGADGFCILNCGEPEDPSNGAYEAPGY